MASSREKRDSPELSWGVRIPIFSNPFIWWDSGKWLGLALFLVYLFVLFCAWSSGELSEYWGWISLIFAASAVGLTMLAVLILVGLFHNRYAAQLTINSDGARFQSGGLGKAVAEAAGEAGFTLGVSILDISALGTGLMAFNYSDVHLPWSKVRKITAHSRYRAITLSNRWRPVIRLYCPDQKTYEQALRICRSYGPGAKCGGSS